MSKVIIFSLLCTFLCTLYSYSQITINNNHIVLLSTEDLLDDDEGDATNIPTIVSGVKDGFFKTAAYNYSQARFKVRGYNSSEGLIFLNGVLLNKHYNGRAQWSNWGGLNDVLRNQTFNGGLSASNFNFGGLLSSINMNTRASEYQKGAKVSYASANKSYSHRFMASYATGLLRSDWAVSALVSRRTAQKGYFEGSSYNANSFFLSAEKFFGKSHSFNLTAFYTPNERGKSSPNTQEVYDLNGLRYNAYWGFDNNTRRNSRVKIVKEPIAMLTHNYHPNDYFSIESSIMVQMGEFSNSRLGYFNAPNPDPTYYKKLPSYFAAQNDFSSAYLATQRFQNDDNHKQINWSELYEVNQNLENNHENLQQGALYYLYTDNTNDQLIALNSSIDWRFSDKIHFNAGLQFQKLNSKNHAKMLDLLGGNYFLDLDPFSEGDAQQQNLNTPNRSINVGDDFSYNYNLNSGFQQVFLQAKGLFKKIETSLSIKVGSTGYQRDGLYKNGQYSENSFGTSEKSSFFEWGIKWLATYKFSGNHIFSLETAMGTKSPTIQNSFSNVRLHNGVTPNLTTESFKTANVTYHFKFPLFSGRITGYHSLFSNAVESSFFFAEGLRGDDADFVSEMLTGIQKKHQGLEFYIEAEVLPDLNINAVAAVGKFIYNNNPQLHIQSNASSLEGEDYGLANLQNYRLSGTPQQAFSLGFSYNDPDFWWCSMNLNYLRRNYIDVSPILRTEHFFLDIDGLPLNNIDSEKVKNLLTQEEFEPALLLNLTAGKSWKIGKYKTGFFLSANNILGEVYKTGGFEQSRKANYNLYKQDQELDKPLFGNKYWYGIGASYFLSFYIKF